MSDTIPPTADSVDRGAGARAVERELRENPTSFSFYQALRLLSYLHPERARIGRWVEPSTEIVRLAANSSLGFPASEIQEFALGEASYGPGAAPPRMTVNFFGLTGPQGVLPHAYSEHAATRTRARDTAFRDFLDIFNHRAISLLFRAWEKNQSSVSHEAGIEDQLFTHLLDLVGHGTLGMRERLPVNDEAIAYFAGLLSTRARSADGLARLLSDYFDVPASVEQFVGDWRSLDDGGQLSLGADGPAGQLGFGVLGDAGWDPQSRVRVRLGPLTREQFDSFVPGGSAHESLCALARLYADDIVGVDAQLVLSRREVRPCILDVPSPERMASATRLGRGTWLASRPLARDPDETTLRLC